MRHLLLGAAVACLTLFLAPLTAFAWWDTGYVYITSLSDPIWGHGMVVTISSGSAPGGCSVDRTAFAVADTDPAYKEKASILMAAYLGGKQVRLLYSPDSGDCAFGHPRIQGIYTRDPQ